MNKKNIKNMAMLKKSSIILFFFAISFGMFSQCILSAKPESKFVITLVNSTKQTGEYLYLWNQINHLDNQVSNDKYRAVLELKDSEASTSFKISSNSPHVSVPYVPTGKIEFPFNPPISVNSSIYAKGDTVCIRFEVKKTQSVILKIEKE
jgi:hypothetical protein